MHFKYSTILNTVFVTFMYGLQLPMLFPIAAFTFFNYYLVEKILITYFYQKPPIYDEKLNKVAIKILMFAPVVMMISAFWTLGNRQLFNNEISDIVYQDDPVRTGHTGLEFTEINPCTPFLFIGLFFMLALTVGA